MVGRYSRPFDSILEPSAMVMRSPPIFAAGAPSLAGQTRHALDLCWIFFKGLTSCQRSLPARKLHWKEICQLEERFSSDSRSSPPIPRCLLLLIAYPPVYLLALSAAGRKCRAESSEALQGLCPLRGTARASGRRESPNYFEGTQNHRTAPPATALLSHVARIRARGELNIFRICLCVTKWQRELEEHLRMSLQMQDSSMFRQKLGHVDVYMMLVLMTLKDMIVDGAVLGELNMSGDFLR
eukprot:748338-Hanusia_phi.AAC.5